MSSHLSTLSRPLLPQRTGMSLLSLIVGLDSLGRSRRALRDLSAAQLEDIGLTRDAADREAKRAPWNAPGHWLSQR
jgi:uncharacterized protein YjiS (DUF1127 family)